MLRWNLIIVIIMGVIGCSTTKIDWEMACGINTVEAYQAFLKKHPGSEFSKQAQTKVEPVIYQEMLDKKTAIGYSSYLLNFPQGPHAETIRARLRMNRCLDSGIMKTFPAWLRRGKPTDPQRHGSWFLDKTFVGIPPSDIGRGYKACGDDPAYPLEMDWGKGYLIYYGGRGIIVGPDGTNVLVGYDCK